MGKRFFRLMGMTILTASLAAQTAGLDPALLAKANGGDAAAQVQLGESYAAGKGVAPDLHQAAEWYKKAADKGDLAAELHLAQLYRDGGKNFPHDMAQAAEWYRKAAERGDPGAQATLATLYSIGQGVPQNYLEAYYWLYLAAAAKGPQAGAIRRQPPVDGHAHHRRRTGRS